MRNSTQSVGFELAVPFGLVNGLPILTGEFAEMRSELAACITVMARIYMYMYDMRLGFERPFKPN